MSGTQKKCDEWDARLQGGSDGRYAAERHGYPSAWAKSDEFCDDAGYAYRQAYDRAYEEQSREIREAEARRHAEQQQREDAERAERDRWEQQAEYEAAMAAQYEADMRGKP